MLQAAAVSLYVSFMVFACHVRKPVWFLFPEDDGIELPGLSVSTTFYILCCSIMPV